VSESSLTTAINTVSEKLEKDSSLMIIFSDDADGVAAAAIASYLAEKLNNEYTLVCLDKVFPEALEMIFREDYDQYMFLDLGGPIHVMIPEKMRRRVYIIDHHEEVIEVPHNTPYINPTKFKLSGDYATTSTILYFIYKHRFGKDKDVAWISLIGIGEVKGEFKGLNWRAFAEAELLGVARRAIRGDKMSFHIHVKGYSREITSLYKDITLASSVGYYADGPLRVVEALIFKDFRMIKEDASRYKIVRQDAYKRGIEALEKEGLFQLKRVQWFMDTGIFNSMGTRVFDSFTSYVRFQGRLVFKNKYILGLMRRQKKIPGLGNLRETWTNVAIRVPRYLETLILSNNAQSVVALAEAVAYQVGGLGYGYQTLGAATIPSSSEDSFIKMFNELASEVYQLGD